MPNQAKPIEIVFKSFLFQFYSKLLNNVFSAAKFYETGWVRKTVPPNPLQLIIHTKNHPLGVTRKFTFLFETVLMEIAFILCKNFHSKHHLHHIVYHCNILLSVVRKLHNTAVRMYQCCGMCKGYGISRNFLWNLFPCRNLMLNNCFASTGEQLNWKCMQFISHRHQNQRWYF